MKNKLIILYILLNIADVVITIVFATPNRELNWIASNLWKHSVLLLVCYKIVGTTIVSLLLHYLKRCKFLFYFVAIGNMAIVAYVVARNIITASH